MGILQTFPGAQPVPLWAQAAPHRNAPLRLLVDDGTCTREVDSCLQCGTIGRQYFSTVWFLHCLSHALFLFFVTSQLSYSLATSCSCGPPGKRTTERTTGTQTGKCRLMEPWKFNSLQCVFVRFSNRCAMTTTGIAISSVLFSLKVFRSLWNVCCEPF